MKIKIISTIVTVSCICFTPLSLSMRLLYTSLRYMSITFLLTMRFFFDIVLFRDGGDIVKNEELKDRIKKIRKYFGLTQEEFAKKLGTVQKHNNWL